ncbi:MAG: twin transmembrane helix small protein [Rhodospirillales bacterium]
MTGFLTVLLMVVMLAVLGVLIAGIVGVARGGNPVRSNRLMRWRVMLQGLALLIFVMLMLSRG